MAFVAPLAIPLLAGGGAAAAGGSLATAMTIGSTVLEGISGFGQKQYQASIAKNNARIAAENADRASNATQIEQMRSDIEYASQEATAKATQSASGLDVLGASQVATRLNIERVRGQEALDIRQQGLIKVQNFQQEEANFLGEAKAAETQAWMGLAASAFTVGGAISKDKGLSKGFNSMIGGAKSVIGGIF
jgi:uncharacterized protein involved in copper resistance